MDLKISAESAGKRIDKLLAEKLPDFSRAKIQKMIKKGGISVNEKPVSAHYKLKEKDRVRILKTEKQACRESGNGKRKTEKKFKLDIVADEKDYLVINKPAGLTMHGAPQLLILKKRLCPIWFWINIPK